MLSAHQSKVVRYWETRRLIFNAALLLAAWLGWGISNSFNVAIDEIPGARIGDPGVLFRFGEVFAVLNLALTLGYAVEFFCSADSPRQFWPKPFRTVFFVVICLACMWIVGGRAGKIAVDAAYTKAGVFGHGAGKHP